MSEQHTHIHAHTPEHKHTHDGTEPATSSEFQSRQSQLNSGEFILNTLQDSITSQLGQSNSVVQNEENKKLVSDVNTIQSLQRNLQDEKINDHTAISQNIEDSYKEAVNQTVLTNIIKNEMERSDHSKDKLLNAKNNKLRMIELNTYEREKNDAYIKVLMYIIYLCIGILGLSILARFKLLNSSMYSMGVTVSIAVAIIMIANKVIDINRRDPLIFSKYNFDFDAAAARAANLNPDNADSSKSGLSCVNEDCCDVNGPTPHFDKNSLKCVSKPLTSNQSSNGMNNQASTQPETFISGRQFVTELRSNTSIKPFSNNLDNFVHI